MDQRIGHRARIVQREHDAGVAAIGRGRRPGLGQIDRPRRARAVPPPTPGRPRAPSPDTSSASNARSVQRIGDLRGINGLLMRPSSELNNVKCVTSIGSARNRLCACTHSARRGSPTWSRFTRVIEAGQRHMRHEAPALGLQPRGLQCALDLGAQRVQRRVGRHARPDRVHAAGPLGRANPGQHQARSAAPAKLRQCQVELLGHMARHLADEAQGDVVCSPAAPSARRAAWWPGPSGAAAWRGAAPAPRRVAWPKAVPPRARDGQESGRALRFAA